MTPQRPPFSGAVSNTHERDPDGSALRRIPDGQLANLWLSEVPKVVQRHEAERLQVRKALGLIS
jgi:hypothetical protein